MLHRMRRRLAGATIRRQSPIHSVLAVCHGNICRSPYAEAVLGRLLTPAGIAVSSAGFVWPGRPVPPVALAVASERGVDLSEHRSRLVTPELIRESQLVVVMDARQARDIERVAHNAVILGDFDPEPIDSRAIRDPWLAPAEVFADVYARIDRCSEALVRALQVA